MNERLTKSYRADIGMRVRFCSQTVINGIIVEDFGDGTVLVRWDDGEEGTPLEVEDLRHIELENA